MLVHADDHATKFECLMHMLRKLYCFVQGGCGEDNADALSNQELLLPGHLLSAFVKEKLDEALELVLSLHAQGCAALTAESVFVMMEDGMKRKDVDACEKAAALAKAGYWTQRGEGLEASLTCNL